MCHISRKNVWTIIKKVSLPTAVKSTTLYTLFTTYVNLALRQMVTSVFILYPKYTLS